MKKMGNLVAVIISIAILFTACSSDPTTEYLRQGDTYYDQGQFVEALAEYSKAIERSPNLVTAYTHR